MSKTCNGCGTEKMPTSVPYVVHETAMARAERQNKWLVWLIALLITLLMGTNIGWLIYESQFEEITETYSESYDIEASGNGNAIY